MGQTKRYFR